MLIVNFVELTEMQLAAGCASDKGMPRLWSSRHLRSCPAVRHASLDLTSVWYLDAFLLALVGCWASYPRHAVPSTPPASVQLAYVAHHVSVQLGYG
jgi:hypothetical protein